jgi:hypothetical protein
LEHVLDDASAGRLNTSVSGFPKGLKNEFNRFLGIDILQHRQITPHRLLHTGEKISDIGIIYKYEILKTLLKRVMMIHILIP